MSTENSDTLSRLMCKQLSVSNSANTSFYTVKLKHLAAGTRGKHILECSSTLSHRCREQQSEKIKPEEQLLHVQH